MKFFLLNEIVPENIPTIDFSKGLENTLKEYKILKDSFKESIDGIVTSSVLENIILADNCTLADSLKNIENIDVRNYGYSVLTKYPVEAYLPTEEILEAGIEHAFLLNTVEKDAFFLKVIYDTKGVSFTLNLHTDLSKNGLPIYTKNNQDNFLVENLYGLDENTQYIKELIEKEEQSKLENFDKLLNILNKPVYSSKLELAFKKESKEVQDAIIEGFETVIENQKKGNISPEALLKDVTPPKETKFNIKELKTRDPRAKRLYFSTVNDKYYLASLEDKPLKDRRTKEQNSHIKNAHSKLKEWLK
ncbi:hypothetical protein HXZ94_08075 [Empedobacter falsenii]|uniref:hypothetical protein n=1 Tax=Empedobacter falsenii TaxID=343874 RepID=UPI0025773E9A|nr:hypothetical protein [Empedobacter falsenii]MDM1298461.1 hypothetical protein [Empedobacter falsenii]MDM1318254.1 hypothetical protein [Empedobacter falsenii]